jgi:ATP-dependent protease HslVU (ClpYQ) peptidase subunit
MTVIVTLKDDAGHIWMGADRYNSIGKAVFNSTDPKIWRQVDTRGNVWVFGMTGTATLAKVARNLVPLPDLNDKGSKTLSNFLFTTWVPKLYEESKNIGLIQKLNSDNGVETSPGIILIGVCGEIIRESAFCPVPVDATYHTAGLGQEVTAGAMEILLNHALHPAKTSEEILRAAIEATGRYCPSIGGGVDIINTYPE